MATIRNLMQQRSSIFKRLKVAESMKMFLTQQLDNDKELRTRLEQTESDLAATQKAILDEERLLKKTNEEMEAVKIEARWMGEEKKVVEAKCKDME